MVPGLCPSQASYGEEQTQVEEVATSAEVVAAVQELEVAEVAVASFAAEDVAAEQSEDEVEGFVAE